MGDTRLAEQARAGRRRAAGGSGRSKRGISPLLFLLLAGCGPRLGSRDGRCSSKNRRGGGDHLPAHQRRERPHYLPETIGSGCAFLDYDGDGHLDLFLVNSGPLPGFHGAGRTPSALYRGDGKGIHRRHPGSGPGRLLLRHWLRRRGLRQRRPPGLYLTALGPNHLFHNNGNGTFTDATQKAGVGDPRFSSSAALVRLRSGRAARSLRRQLRPLEPADERGADGCRRGRGIWAASASTRPSAERSLPQRWRRRVHRR